MEISLLDFEMTNITKSTSTTSVLKGKTIYDPLEKTLVFYDLDENQLFTKSIEEISLIPHLVKENKFVFKDESLENLFSVTCSKNDTLEMRSFRYLLNNIITLSNKKLKTDDKNDTKYIISKAKDYQLEILEMAKKRNTIVFLETGLGKTYISVLLIKHLFGEPVESNYYDKVPYKKASNKKVIFLFKTISLLLQQSKVLKLNTNLRVLKLYGGQEGSNTPPFGKFRSLIEKYDIVCATPETIYRYFTFGYLSVDDLALIVLDECHHTKDKDFYNLILKHFIHLNTTTSEIRILGLTASPSFDNEKTEEKITENIQNLCNNMNCYLACPSNILKDTPYSDNSNTDREREKELSFILIDKFSQENTKTCNEIKIYLYREVVMRLLTSYMKHKEHTSFKISNENFEPLLYSALLLTLLCEEDKISEKQIGIFEKEDYDILNNNLMACELNDTYKAFLEKFKLEAEKIDNDKVNFSREMREFYKKTQEDFVIEETRKFVKNVNLILKYIDLDTVIAYSSEFTYHILNCYFANHKLEEVPCLCLKNINQLAKMQNIQNYASCYLTGLQSFFSEIINSCTPNSISNSSSTPKSIVFVNHRLITKHLNDKMNIYLNKQGYSAKFVLGCQSSSSIPFSEEELKSNIETFTFDSKCLVLFATNVVEEGIDVPQCNNVINLSEIKTIKEYIQKTGRARKSDSRFLLCCDASECVVSKEKIDQIKISIKVMKKIISENKLFPVLKKERNIAGLTYYQTEKGAKVFLSYAKKMIEEFVGKLFFDGYNYLRAVIKIEDVTEKGKVTYRPYLSLPCTLESSFCQIYDHPEITFATKDFAKTYINKYGDFYYLKAVKMLHVNHYFNNHLLFAKNYDDLMMVENNCSKFLSEPQIKIKTGIVVKESNESEEVELIAHILNISPNFIDINYCSDSNGDTEKIVAVISDTPLTLINFDLYIHSTLLIKLYHFNTAYDESDENKERFTKKPKIPYNVFTKINVSMNCYQAIKVKRSDLPLINFLYTYLLLSSTDAEMFFYYSLHTRKFGFANDLFLNDDKTRFYLTYIFDKYAESIPETKKHLADFKNCDLQYANHIVKFCLINKGVDGKLSFDINYIKNLVKSVKEDIKVYYRFIIDCVVGEDNIKRMLIEPEFLYEKEDKLLEKRNDVEAPSCGTLCRNMINYEKQFIMNYGYTDLRGTTIYKGRFENNNNNKKKKKTLDNKHTTDYQRYFLEKYGVLTDRFRDYKKCLPLDYNQKVLKYKVNLNQVGKVSRNFHKTHFLKKFNFLPNEVLQSINYFSVDQLHLFTLFPVMLYKIQHCLIYYYQASCLRKRFNSFVTLKQIDIRLLTQSLNSRSTMEYDNYERLEFLGDSVLKFLSSFEVFKTYPQGNRDLLYSKRRALENNKTLCKFAKSEENKLDKFLFTTPMTIRRVKIPGFNNDETLMFNIGYNKSFAKSCFFNRQVEKKMEAEDKNFNGIDMEKFKMDPCSDLDKIDLDKMESNEEQKEKTMINIPYEENSDPVYTKSEVLVDEYLIDEVVNNKIEIIQPKTFRILYNKILADILESLTGFLIHSSVFIESSISNMFDRCSLFLSELGVLKLSFDLSDSFWLTNLPNEACKFSHEQRSRFVRPLNDNGKYKFENIDLLYQAVTHTSYLSEESMKANFPYVKRSYQRLAFLGEAFVTFYVSLWVYQRNPEANECLLHKLKICGINHHITSLIAIDMHMDDCLLQNDRDMTTDLLIYKTKFLESKTENKFKIPNENILDDNFIIVLCEMFHAYIGAVLLDSKSVEKTYFVLKEIMDDYLINNATFDTFTEHPKVTILDEFMKRRVYFKKIRENGSNRVNMKNEKGEKFRRMKMYKYQLIIDKFIIYEEYIYYNRSTIKIAQEKAKEIFLKICYQIDKREKLGLNLKYFELEQIIIFLGIPYEKIQI